MENGSELTIKDLYPNLSDEQLRESEEHFDAYLEVIWRIYERVSSDPESYANLRTLTDSQIRPYDVSRKVKND